MSLSLDEVKFTNEVNDYYYLKSLNENDVNSIVIINADTSGSTSNNPWDNGNGKGPPFNPPPFNVVPEFDLFGLYFGIGLFLFMAFRRKRNQTK